ncbi:MAG: hypothetical protein ACT60Q_11700, partial [Ferrovibrionaceae bacterium]
HRLRQGHLMGPAGLLGLEDNEALKFVRDGLRYSATDTYDVKLDPESAAYCRRVMAWPDMVEWVEAARSEPDEVEELDVEF